MLVYDQAHRLAKELRESEEYRNLIQSKEKVNEVESNRAMLEDFQKKQLELQKAHMSGETVDQKKVEELEKLMEIMMSNPIIRDYRMAELRLVRLMGDIENILWGAVKDGLFFKDALEG